MVINILYYCLLRQFYFIISKYTNRKQIKIKTVCYKNKQYLHLHSANLYADYFDSWLGNRQLSNR